MSSISRSHTFHQMVSDNHKIFQICHKCGFDTLRFPGVPRRQEPTYVCPKCHAPAFVHSCSACHFARSSECPLTQLLDGPSGSTMGQQTIHTKAEPGRACAETDAYLKSHYKALAEKLQAVALETKDTGIRRRNSPSAYIPSRSGVENTTSAKTHLACQSPVSGFSSPQGRGTSICEDCPRPENFGAQTCDDCPQILEPQICEDCQHHRCSICRPAFMNLFVDMGDFSKTFADEMRLCTLCKHAMCPGNRLDVLFRCKVCGHDECVGCEGESRIDNVGDEWAVCCRCQGSDLGE